ncbi:transposase DNA-binding-containing protein [Serratia symbiotica]|uniref:IS4/Tn5 family transposase DNA-binding protein n=1 Tax=Serratia symbiotica TaxID=138074 RepID=UPI001E37DE90|nr:transposase DNA-binding-containing protein [Serratia symbiotica]
MIDSVPISASPLVWIDEKIDLSTFSDRRHASRFKSLMQKLWQGMGNSLPFACQDRAATKAAYRFLSSTKIDEQTFLQGHTEATCQKVQATQEETILLLQDTTSFGYHRNNPDLVGFSGRALNASFSLYIHYGLRLGNGKYCTLR